MVPLTVLRMPMRVPKPRAVVDWSAFRDAPFMVFTLGVLICSMGQAVLIFYISFHPADRGFTDPSLAFYTAAIFNAVLGRILPNALSDRIGVFNTIAPFTTLLGVTMLCLLDVRNAAGMIVEAVVTGFFSGVVVALSPVCFRVLTENKSMIGTRIGQGFAIRSPFVIQTHSLAKFVRMRFTLGVLFKRMSVAILRARDRGKPG